MGDLEIWQIWWRGEGEKAIDESRPTGEVVEETNLHARIGKREQMIGQSSVRKFQEEEKGRNRGRTKSRSRSRPFVEVSFPASFDGDQALSNSGRSLQRPRSERESSVPMFQGRGEVETHL